MAEASTPGPVDPIPSLFSVIKRLMEQDSGYLAHRHGGIPTIACDPFGIGPHTLSDTTKGGLQLWMSVAVDHIPGGQLRPDRFTLSKQRSLTAVEMLESDPRHLSPRLCSLVFRESFIEAMGDSDIKQRIIETKEAVENRGRSRLNSGHPPIYKGGFVQTLMSRRLTWGKPRFVQNVQTVSRLWVSRLYNPLTWGFT